MAADTMLSLPEAAAAVRSDGRLEALLARTLPSTGHWSITEP